MPEFFQNLPKNQRRLESQAENRNFPPLSSSGVESSPKRTHLDGWSNNTDAARLSPKAEEISKNISMALPLTNSNAADGHVLTAIAKRHRDGSVLLSAADDRICKLNGVGALTWMILEQNREALSVDQVVLELSRQFAAINSQGELCYDVPHAQLRQDTERFLKTLTRKKLLRVVVDEDGREVYAVNNGVSGTTSATVSALGKAKQRRDTGLSGCSQPAPAALPDINPSKRETMVAFLGLLAFDLMLRVSGFNALITRVEHWPIANRTAKKREISRRVRAVVDRAQMYYPKKAMCLQHSAVVTCLLRREGVPAEMVLAAKEFPPAAHAWVEVANEVVNDSADVKTRYREFRRL